MSAYAPDQLERFLNAAVKDSTSSFRLFLASRGYAGKKVNRYTVLTEFVLFTDLQWAKLELSEVDCLEIEPL